MRWKLKKKRWSTSLDLDLCDGFTNSSMLKSSKKHKVFSRVISWEVLNQASKKRIYIYKWVNTHGWFSPSQFQWAMQRDIRFNELIYLIQWSRINARFIATSAHGSCLKRPPFGLLVIATPGSMYQLRFDDMAWLETKIGSLFFRFRMVIRELTVGVLLWTYDKVLPAFMFQVPSILLQLIYCGSDACISILN